MMPGIIGYRLLVTLLKQLDTIPVDLVGISRTPVKKLRAYETGNPRSSSVSVNYIGLKELT